MTTATPSDAASAEDDLRGQAAKLAALIEEYEAALTDARRTRDDLIREFRANTDLSIPAIADAVGVSESTVKGALPRTETPRRPGRRAGKSTR